jgi:hypothetical protein
MLEAIERIEQMTGLKLDWCCEDEARKGDHICYISNLGKFQTHYPNWKITRGLETILKEIISSQRGQLAKNVVKLSQEAHVDLSYRRTQRFLQTSALPPRDGLQVFL